MSIFQTYSILSQVASQYSSGAIVQKVLEIFKILIYCEEVEFLRENTFLDALLNLISSFLIIGSLLVSVDVEKRITYRSIIRDCFQTTAPAKPTAYLVPIERNNRRKNLYTSYKTRQGRDPLVILVVGKRHVSRGGTAS